MDGGRPGRRLRRPRTKLDLIVRVWAPGTPVVAGHRLVRRSRVILPSGAVGAARTHIRPGSSAEPIRVGRPDRGFRPGVAGAVVRAIRSAHAQRVRAGRGFVPAGHGLRATSEASDVAVGDA